MDERDTLRIEYDFQTQTGTVVFVEGHTFVLSEVVEYFEDASNNKVKVIHTSSGHSHVTLGRDKEGKWVVIAGA